MINKIPVYLERKDFIDNMISLETSLFNKFKNNQNLFDYWIYYKNNRRLGGNFSKMEQSGLVSFLEKYGVIEISNTNLLENLQKNDDFFKYWDNLSDTERLAKNQLEHFNDFYKVKIETKSIDMKSNKRFWETLEGIPHKSKKAYEYRSWIDTEIQFNCKFRPIGRINGKLEPGDAFGLDGIFKGKYVDWTSITENAVATQFDHINNLNRYNESIKQLKSSIDRHLNKLIKAPEGTTGPIDHYICDMRFYTEKMKQDIFDYYSLSHPNQQLVELFLSDTKTIILNP